MLPCLIAAAAVPALIVAADVAASHIAAAEPLPCSTLLHVLGLGVARTGGVERAYDFSDRSCNNRTQDAPNAPKAMSSGPVASGPST